MIMCHHIRFGCKNTNSSVDMVETVIFDYMNPHCNIGLENIKPIFSHDTLAYANASSYYVWLQKVQ